MDGLINSIAKRIKIMNDEFKGKVALITGSSRGIGLSIAKYLYKNGCKVIINSKNYSDLDDIISNSKENVVYMNGDMTSESEALNLVNKVIEKFNKIDFLVTCVGSGVSVAPGDETTKEVERMFSINFFSAINIIYKCLPYLEKTKGSIVCISSICGVEVIPNSPVGYSASKAALNSYVKGLARPLGAKGIRINAVAPGNILFKGSTWEKKIKENEDKVLKYIKSETSIGTFGKPNDIASATSYLLSPCSNFITGTIFVIDGGQTRAF